MTLTLKFLFFATAVLFFDVQNAYGQSCCTTASVTSEFADMGANEIFALAHLEPQAIDFQGVGHEISIPTAGKEAKGYLVRSKTPSKEYLFVIHEWWGLNDHIKQMAEEYARILNGVNVLCLDLYDGRNTDDKDIAAKLMQKADESRIREIIQGAAEYTGGLARVQTVGWCFGGGWSLQASLILGRKGTGCVMYYGMPEKDLKTLEQLNAPVLGIFAEQDGWITPEIVAEFEDKLMSIGKEVKILSYDAEHAFANPSNPQYDRKSTALAHAEAIKFLRANLGTSRK